jgi:hypothetical protein
MRSAQPIRFLLLGTFLVGAFVTATALPGAQPVSPAFPLPHKTVWTAGGEETSAPPEEPVAGSPAPTEDAVPYRPPAFLKMVLLDTGHVLSAPARWRGREWLVFAGSTAALATMSLADESLSDSARESGPSSGFAGEMYNQLGGGGSVLLLGGFYLAGVIGKDSKAKNVCLDGLTASLIATGMITPVMGTLVGRERPTEEQGAYSFHPSEGRAFPSGHATQVFAVASVIATSYDQLWVKAAAYGLASMTAWERVRRGKHFPTDVVAGAAIGTLVGHSVVRFNTRLRSGEKEPESTGARLTLVPVVGAGTYGVSATLDF